MGKLNSFIPVIWIAKLLTALKPELVSEAFVNHDYQGEVMGAGSVKINTLSKISVTDYDPNGKISYDDLETTEQTMNIDTQKKISFRVDDVEKAQTKDGVHLMATAMKEAAFALANIRDTLNFSALVDGAGVTVGSVDAPISVTTSDEAKEVLLRLVEEADNANVPQDGRVVAISPRFKSLLMADKYISIAPPTTTDVLVKGHIGTLYGLDLYVTNNLPKDTDNNLNYVVLSHKKFMTEATQIEKMEALRDIDAFKDLVRALDVSGRKVTRPEGVIKVIVNYNKA